MGSGIAVAPGAWLTRGWRLEAFALGNQANNALGAKAAPDGRFAHPHSASALQFCRQFAQSRMRRLQHNSAQQGHMLGLQGRRATAQVFRYASFLLVLLHHHAPVGLTLADAILEQLISPTPS